MSNAVSYESDLYAWAMEQAALLRSGRLAEADVANIAEEIESVGRSEKSELVNRLAAEAFPETCPWTPEQVLDEAFLPE